MNIPFAAYRVYLLLVILLCFFACTKQPEKETKADVLNHEIDNFINNPFTFTILKNYSDNYASIGSIINSSPECPLAKENIADSSFCFIRKIEYDGLTIRVFSFDVLQGGTAEYIVTKKNVKLRNGITIGTQKNEVKALLGTPYKIRNTNNVDMYVWRSSDMHNFLAITFTDDCVTHIRWHEEREPSYKNTVVWTTSYE